MPVDAGPPIQRMNPPPWGDGSRGATTREATIRGRLLQTFAASDDPGVELALWEMPAGEGPEPLSEWLAWWAFARPAYLRARLAGYTLPGADVIAAVNEITRTEASAPPLVTVVNFVAGVRQDAARYEWHGLEPLMFLRAPVVGGFSPDLWKQLDAWPCDVPAIPPDAEPTDEIFNGGQVRSELSATAGTSPAVVQSRAENGPSEPTAGGLQPTLGERSGGRESGAGLPAHQSTSPGNPLAAAMPPQPPMPDWFGKEPPKEKKRRAPKPRASADQEPDHGTATTTTRASDA